MSDNIIEATSTTFDELITSSKLPVIIDLWAPWCGPCLTFAPILAQVAIKYKDKLIVAKLNVDENSDISNRYDVKGIPTLLVFKNAKLQTRLVGARSKIQLEADLKEFIS
jgi:thioredoxin